MAAIVLILGEAAKTGGDFNAFINDYTDGNTTRELAQAMALVSVLEDRVDQVSEGPLRNILMNLYMISGIP